MIETALLKPDCPIFKNVRRDGINIFADHIIIGMKCKIFCDNALFIDSSKLIR